MAFTPDRLYVVRVEDGRPKTSYPIKSVQLAPSDKVNQASDTVGLKFCQDFVIVIPVHRKMGGDNAFTVKT